MGARRAWGQGVRAGSAVGLGRGVGGVGVWWVGGWCVEGGALTSVVVVSMQLRFRREGLIACFVDRGGLSVVADCFGLTIFSCDCFIDCFDSFVDCFGHCWY